MKSLNPIRMRKKKQELTTGLRSRRSFVSKSFYIVSDENICCIYTERDLAKFFIGMKKNSVLTIDLEDTGNDFIDGEIFCAGFGLKQSNGIWKYGIVNFLDENNCELDNDIVGAFIKKLYDNGLIKTIVAHSFNHEYKWIRSIWNLDIDGYHRFCTLVAGWFVNENRLSQGLKDVCKEVQVFYSKDEKKYGAKFSEIDTDKQYRYSGKDIVAESRLFDLRTEQLEELELLEMFYTQEMLFNWTCGLMEWNGAYVNKPKIYDIYINLNHLLRRIAKGLKKIAGREFVPTPSASKQLTYVLFDKLGLKPLSFGTAKTCDTCGKNLSKKTDYKCTEHPDSSTSFIPSSGADTLEYYQKEGNKFCDMLLEYRGLAKLRSTYIEPLPNMILSDGRIHTSYKQHGTKTGRLSSINPNSQNFPAGDKDKVGVRSVFEAPKGWVFIDGDYSQLEPRLLAHFSEDPTLLKTYKNNLDTYIISATKVFNMKYSEITKESEERDIMKTVALAVYYGMGIKSVAKKLGISYEQAKHFVDEYKKLYSRIFGKYGFKNWLIETAKENRGTIFTLLGRPRRVPEIFSHINGVRFHAERQLFNSLPQGSAGDILRLLQIRFYEEFSFKELQNIMMIFQIHDELLFQCRNGYQLEYEKRIKHIAEDFSDVGLELRCPLVFNTKIVNNWGEVK